MITEGALEESGEERRIVREKSVAGASADRDAECVMSLCRWLMLAVVATAVLIAVGCASTDQSRPTRTPSAYEPPRHYGVDGWYKYHGYDY